MLRKLVNITSMLKLSGVLLSGWLLACAFPLPPGLQGMEGGSAAWMALIPLLLVARCSRPKAAFAWGWVSGMLFWLISLAWLLQLRHTWGSPLLTGLAWLALAAYCALFPALFCSLFAALPFADRPGHPPASAGGRLLTVLAAPILWIGTELLRATLFTGFGWNALGVSQYRNIAVIQLAGVGGVYAVSGVIVLLNAALAVTVYRLCRESRQRSNRRRVHAELMLGLLAVALCWSYGVRTVRRAVWTQPEERRLRVAAIQPAIPQVQKWTETHAQDIHAALQNQTSLAMMSKPDLVIWPETATPGMFRFDPDTKALVSSLAAGGAYLLVGSMDLDPAGEARPDRYTNASFLIAPSGRQVGEYHKRHLVPLGEYLPFERHLPLLSRLAPLGFSCVPGPQDQPLPGMPLGDDTVPLSILICFEDVFPYLARRDVRRGARLLLNQTNNAWFDGSAASRQHMANAVLRTVENRVPLVRSANTGITCMINRYGQITGKFISDRGDTELRGFSIVEVRLPDEAMALTLYTRYGDWLLGWPCLILSMGFAGWQWRPRRWRKDAPKALPPVF